MVNAIFQIDWILVDIIIIILLIFLLISVKIFKLTHRWRSSLSNITLDSLYVPDVQNLVDNQYILIKKVRLIRDSSLREKCNKNPSILILRTHYKRNLLRILSEGLGSSGFNVILAKVKIKRYPINHELENIVNEELKLIISTILNWYKKKELIVNHKYILINYFRSIFPYKTIVADNKNRGLILFNPKIKSEKQFNYLEKGEENFTLIYLYIIFSKYSTLLFPNKNLKFLENRTSSQKLKSLKIITLEKARKSFRYYETIVLGIILDIIENKLVKLNN